MTAKIRRLTTAAIALFLFLILLLSNSLYYADMLICDNTYKKLEPQTRDVVIIAIDTATLGEFGGSLTAWSREKSTELIEFLSADPDKAPSVIAFDVMFTGENKADTDARLADAAKKAGNIICASSLTYSGRMEENENGELLYNPSAIVGEEIPFNALASEVKYGFANACISEDNIIRYAQLTAELNGETRYSFAYTAYRAYAEKKGISVNEPKTKGGQIGFFYSGNPGDVPQFSLADVLGGKVPITAFTEKLVFIGAYYSGSQDAYNSSVARGEQMHGVEINANIALALLNNKLANEAPEAIYAAIASIVIVLWVFLLEKQKMWAVIAEGAVLIGAHLFIGRALALSGNLISQIYFSLIVFLTVVYFIIQKYVLEKIKRRHAIGTLKKYVAPQIVDKLSKDGKFELHLGGEKKHIAVLFVDVRGFTTMSESLPPEDVVSILNKYLSVTTNAVFSNDGTLDKFIGDATMAVFNAPFNLDDYIFKAVKTAWDIQSGVSELAKTMDKPINVGVGVNCGEAVVGNIGCSVRMDYTAIGDTVNTAARLESNAKAGQILISQAVYDQISKRITSEPIGELTLKGKNEKVPVYNVTKIGK